MSTALRRTLTLLAVPTAIAALAAPASATTPLPPSTAASALTPAAQGIIMRDGGICDPIRHMGC